MYISPGRKPPFASRRSRLQTLIVLAAALVAVIGTLFLIYTHQVNAPGNKQDTNKTSGATSPVQESFNKSLFSTDDPASIWVVVNKQRPLDPKEYAPGDLRAPHIPLRLSAGAGEMQLRDEAATALEKMAAAGKDAGVNLMLASGYRSYGTQVAVYGNEVKSFGQAKADTESARPGYSEHQTGLAADLEDAGRTCEVADCFADTKEGTWVAAHAYLYGFIIRYTQDKEDVTGYRYEPWHVRYVGTALATELHNKHIETLEEFFNLPGGKNY